ncbi:MAG: hypothetical protein H7067_03105 [Burkholderiales bacterium]|nr:hypothetical protein [Opitutaceae bacterium]
MKPFTTLLLAACAVAANTAPPSSAEPPPFAQRGHDEFEGVIRDVVELVWASAGSDCSDSPTPLR